MAEKTDTEIHPQAQIRRFDVFAEYNRLQGIERGMDEAHAKGYGLWVAKVVANGRRGIRTDQRHEERDEQEEPGAKAEREPEKQANESWHELGGEPQTDELFEHDIVQRMGTRFYSQVFAPAIEAVVERGERYESIRDSIRRDWSPVRH